MAFLRHVVLIYCLFLGIGAQAENIPAPWSWAVPASEFSPGGRYTNAAAACADYAKNYGVGTFDPSNALIGSSGTLPGSATCTLSQPYNGWAFTIQASQFCTEGTLVNVQGVLTCNNVPDCVAPQTRDSVTGTCVSPPCTAGRTFSGSFFGGWRVGPGANQVVGPSGGSYSAPVTQCNGTCVFTSGGATCTSTLAPFVDQAQPITCTGTLTETGATCSVDNTATPATAPTIPNHRPKCSSDEGVLTSSSGTVACVPSGTPSSAPVVRTEKQTQQFPDGSTRTTETTYTKDPVTQVQDTQQQIINTAATGGGAGQAGPVGTTTASGSTQPSSPTDKEASDFCKANGQLQICKGDMNKEQTQIQVRDYIKSLTDPASTPYTGLESAKHSDQSQTDLQSELDKFTSAGTGQFTPDSASRSSWESAMSSGWFEPISRTGCQPYSTTISGRTWNLDICPTAEKISAISEYVIWFFLAVGVFVMFTGGAFTKGS